MAMYNECPICGHLTDDGMFVKTKKALYLVCFDCAESIPDEEIAEIINRKEKEIDSKN